MTTDPAYYDHALDSLRARLNDFMVNNDEEHEKHPSQVASDKYLKRLTDILEEYCALVKQADDAKVPQLQDIINKVDNAFNETISFAYGEADLWNMMPSFAHGDPATLLVDKLPPGIFSAGALEAFMPFMKMLLGDMPKIEARPKPMPPPPWKKTLHPHPNTTSCSRFRDGIPTWTATDLNPNATAVYEARCEMSSDDITAPVCTSLLSNGTCFAVLTAGGYKNRKPCLFYYLPHGPSTGGDFPDTHYTDIGLSGIARYSTIDEERKLIFVGDHERVKSYAWGPVGKADDYSKPLPTHTLDSKEYSGAMLVLPGGRFIRAGKGSAGLWNLDTLPTHGPKGNNIIGEKKDDIAEDSWRDDPENIEASEGSPHDSTIPFEDTSLVPQVWQRHPTLEGTVLCASDKESMNYSCLVLDLERGGKTVTRYLGHGGNIYNFSTAAEDPNVFVTSCSDGLARLYDIRHPLPIFTLDGSRQGSVCTAAAIAHPDGHPFIFTGHDRSQQIIMWDIRARAPIYDLSTGNNEVITLDWSASENSLYASTVCPGVDSLGYHHDYRLARVPHHRDPDAEQNVETMDEDDDDYEDEDSDADDDSEEYEEPDEEKCWPKKAFHSENYYGEVFDAGDHRVYRYQFKTDAEHILPPYGQAMLGESNLGW